MNNPVVKPIQNEDPSPQELIPAGLEPESYPIEALGGLYLPALAIAEEIQVSPAMVGNSLLAAASLLVQDKAVIEIDNRVIPPSLFLLTVAVSGDRKSAIDNLVLDSVSDYQKAKVSEYKEAQKLYKGQKADALKDQSIELPDLPLKPLFLHNETTMDGLLRAFDNGPKSQGLFLSEGASFFGGHAMNDSQAVIRTLGIMSKLWDGGQIAITRADENRNAFVDGLLACHLMLQPVIACRVTADELFNEQGFLARFLIAYPKSQQGERLYKEPDQQNWKTINQLKEFIKAKLESKLIPVEPARLRVSVDAKQLWIKAYNAIEVELREHGTLKAISPIAAKMAEQILRIAGVLTLFNEPQASKINEQVMLDAIELGGWYLNEALRVRKNNSLDLGVTDAEDLKNYLVSQGNALFVRRDVQRSGPNKLRNDKNRLDAAFELLQDNHWIIRLPPGVEIGGVKSREAWRINNHAL